MNKKDFSNSTRRKWHSGQNKICFFFFASFRLTLKSKQVKVNETYFIAKNFAEHIHQDDDRSLIQLLTDTNTYQKRRNYLQLSLVGLFYCFIPCMTV